MRGREEGGSTGVEGSAEPVALGERQCHDCSKVMPIVSFSRVRGIRTDVCHMCAALRRRAKGQRARRPESHRDYYERNPYASNLGTWGSIPD